MEWSRLTYSVSFLEGRCICGISSAIIACLNNFFSSWVGLINTSFSLKVTVIFHLAAKINPFICLVVSRWDCTTNYYRLIYAAYRPYNWEEQKGKKSSTRGDMVRCLSCQSIHDKLRGSPDWSMLYSLGYFPLYYHGHVCVQNHKPYQYQTQMAVGLSEANPYFFLCHNRYKLLKHSKSPFAFLFPFWDRFLFLAPIYIAHQIKLSIVWLYVVDDIFSRGDRHVPIFFLFLYPFSICYHELQRWEVLPDVIFIMHLHFSVTFLNRVISLTFIRFLKFYLHRNQRKMGRIFYWLFIKLDTCFMQPFEYFSVSGKLIVFDVGVAQPELFSSFILIETF